MLSSLQIATTGALPMPAPWLLKGFQDSGGGRAAIARPDLFPRRRNREKLRVVNFIGLSGPAGIWGLAGTNSMMLAASEINRRGGILGREIEPVFHDAGGDIDGVVRTAADMIAAGDADVIMGSHISAVRVALRKVIAGRVPYIYTPVYEGGERTPGVMAIGETPRDQSRPAIEWLASEKKAARWYLIGSDYVWPWLAHKATKTYIAGAGGRVVGEEFVALGEQNHDAQIARIRAAKPDVVVISLIGTDSIVFNRAFAEHGLSSKVLRLAGAMDETLLLGMGADSSEGLYCASGYFVDRASAANDAFRAQYEASFGRCAPVPGSVAQSNYEGLRFLESVATNAGSFDVRPMLNAASSVAYHGARGEVSMRGGRAKMPIYLAEADGLDFRLIRTF
ncbi:substrate-binding domain-containing protein [Tardiphaga sp. 215_C5_N2_1]|uniref:substrate-binding domain-containing protein n=1 Tax=Tardiphaga sp. 215_C5_N2_1 TaxID=3240774 RepID=UPI003F893687